jgi:hypothetical protein
VGSLEAHFYRDTVLSHRTVRVKLIIGHMVTYLHASPILRPYFSKIYSNIIFPSASLLPKWPVIKMFSEDGCLLGCNDL